MASIDSSASAVTAPPGMAVAMKIGTASRWYLPAVEAWIVARVQQQHPEQIREAEVV